MNIVRFARSLRFSLHFRFPAILLLLGWLLLSGRALSAAESETGVIVGQVSNLATGAFLEGARIDIVGQANPETAGAQGRFRFVVPRGPVTLRVSYTGLDAQEVVVDVAAGATVTQNIALTAGVYRLEAFNVAGLREGSALAITQQRNAPNVKNVVSSDSFGNMADGNIGDFLQQLPGVTANYVGADVRSVMVRGIHADLNSVTMDGTRLASAPSGTAARGFEFEQASLGLIETIEVTKSPTPDMDADSIGGNVNLVSKSPFDRASPRFFTYSIGGVWRPKYMTNSREFEREPIDDIGPSLNFAYSDVFGSRKNIGVLLNATYHSQPGGDTAALMNFEPKVADPVYVYNVNAPRPAGAPRTRLSLGAKIDYKLSDRTIITFNTFSNWFHENNDTRIHALTTGNAAANFRPGYTSTFSEILPSAASFSQVSTFNDDKFGRTYAFQPSARHRFPDLEIDYGGSFSNSFTQWEHATKDRHSPWHSPLGQNKGSASAILRNIGWTVDRTESSQWPKLTQTAGPDMYDLNNYSSLMISNADRGQEDVVIAGRANVLKRFHLAVPASIKAGFSYRDQERRAWNHTTNWDYTGPDGVFGNVDDAVGIGQFLDTSGQWKDSNEGYRQPPWISSYAANQHKVLNPQLWAPRITTAATGSLLESMVTFLNNERTASETVTAGYVMGSTRVGRLSILGGVRVEDTDTEAEGPLNVVTPEERTLRAAWVGPVTLEESTRRAVAQYATRTSSSGGYRNVFPGVHFKYELFDGLLVRADYASSIGRPNFENLMPRTTVNDAGTGSVSVSNTALRPQFSDNFDVSAEYYFEPAGVISAGVFLKEVKDFIFNTSSIIGSGADNGFDGQYSGYTLTKSFNGGRARYRGFELAYRQQFTFLPGFWKGFGLNLNYSYTSSYGDYGGASSTSKVAGLVPRTGNINLSYIQRGLDIRLSANWRGTTLVAINANPALERYQKSKLQVNLKTKYSLSPRVQLFCDIENLNKSPITETYWGVENRPAETRIVVAKVVAGVQGRF